MMKNLSPLPLPFLLTLYTAFMLFFACTGSDIKPATIRLTPDISAGAATLAPLLLGANIDQREAWENWGTEALRAAIIKRADELSSVKLPQFTSDLFLDYSKTGNRTRWQDIDNERTKRIRYFVLAECLENKGRFIPKIEELFHSLCQEPTWVKPAHDKNMANFYHKIIDIDLKSSRMGFELALSLSLLGNKLTEQTVMLVKKQINERIFTPFKEMIAGQRPKNFWVHGSNNWNAVCHAGVVGAALLLLEDKNERVFYIDTAVKDMEYYLDGFEVDGYCSEGLGYWNYGFGNFITLAEVIYQATGGTTDLFANPKAYKPALYGFNITIQNSLAPAFADCSVDAKPDGFLINYLSRKLAVPLRQPPNVDYTNAVLFEIILHTFHNSSTNLQPPVVEQAPIRTWFEQTGILISRPLTESGMGVALKGGHNNENHNHNDVGSYVVAVGDQALFIDPGAEVYTARTFSKDRYKSMALNSFGHPVPVIGGTLQAEGAKSRAKILKTVFSAGADTLLMDISSAYPVPWLKSLTREFVYTRDLSLQITDRFDYSEPATFETALITGGRCEITGDNTLEVFDTRSRAAVSVECSAGVIVFSQTFIAEDLRSGQTPLRIGIALKDKVKSGFIRVTVTTREQSFSALPLNGGFEHGNWGWKIPHDGFGEITDKLAVAGKFSLHINDSSTTSGSDILSTPISVAAYGSYILKGNFFGVSGEGLGIYLRFYSSEHNLITDPATGKTAFNLATLGGGEKAWKAFSLPFQTPAECAYIAVWIHSFNSAKVEGYLDDFELVTVE